MRPKVFRGKNVPDNLCFCSQGPCAWKCEECLRCEQHYNDLIDFIKYGDLAKIETTFGLLPEDIQKALKEAWNCKDWNESNIQFYDLGKWTNIKPSWNDSVAYRLDPSYKLEEKSLVGAEVEVKVNGVIYKAVIKDGRHGQK